MFISENFQDNNFAEMCGARIVRIAVHPEYQGMGYGSRWVESLKMNNKYIFGSFLKKLILKKNQIITKVKNFRAMKLLEDYFCGKIMNLEEIDEERVSKKMPKAGKAKEAVESVKVAVILTLCIVS